MREIHIDSNGLMDHTEAHMKEAHTDAWSYWPGLWSWRSARPPPCAPRRSAACSWCCWPAPAPRAPGCSRRRSAPGSASPAAWCPGSSGSPPWRWAAAGAGPCPDALSPWLWRRRRPLPGLGPALCLSGWPLHSSTLRRGKEEGRDRDREKRREGGGGVKYRIKERE